MLAILREIAYISSTNNFQIKAIHLPGRENRIADILSRAPFDPGVKVSSVIDSSWSKICVKDEEFQVRDRW